MAQRVEVKFIDDIDGSEGAETVTFGLDGVTYEIDLNEVNAKDLRTHLEKFVENGRRVGGGRKVSSTSASTGRRTGSSGRGDTNADEIRVWARANGHVVSERGRIKKAVVDAYNAANPSAA